jgi:transcriptional regulator with PAS, ATPase and Fis domain
VTASVLQPKDPVTLPPLIGVSEAIATAKSRLERFARTELPILLMGPTGTGKEVVARHIHAMSSRPGRLVDVNCGALPRDMIESLLFGHRRGAFTGAVESSIGLIVSAHGGTLFLDELTSLLPEGQAKLLRVLESGELTVLGSTVKTSVDFRLVAAVQDDILERVENHQFRRDLFHRLEGLIIQLPPLRYRPEDIEPLTSFFAGQRGYVVHHDAIHLLCCMDWPGNVRQLRSVVERACILADDHFIGARHVRDALDGTIGIKRLAPLAERDRLIQACSSFGNDTSKIAASLGISRATLYRRLKDCGLRLGRES